MFGCWCGGWGRKKAQKKKSKMFVNRLKYILKKILVEYLGQESVIFTSLKTTEDLRPGNSLFSNLLIILSATSSFFAS